MNLMKPFRGGRSAAPFLFMAVSLLAAVPTAGCQSDGGAAADRIGQMDEIIAAQRSRNDRLRAEVDRAEEARRQAEAATARALGTGEAYAEAQAALEKRLKELEGSFQDTGDGITVEAVAGGGYRFVVQGEILFQTGTDELSDAGKAALDRVVAALGKSTEHIRVEGHTDNVPIMKPATMEKYPRGNLELSMARALTVGAHLIHSGIPAARVSCTGYGEFRPRADNGTTEGKRRNRRVEILVEAAGD